MITKIFQGTKKIVEEQLSAYTSCLSEIHSVSVNTTVVEGLDENLPRVIYLTVIVMHKEKAPIPKHADLMATGKSASTNNYSKLLYQSP